MRLFVFVLSLLTLSSCQSATEKAEIELQKKLIRFSSLESRIEKICLVETVLAAPTRAKYQQSFPNQADSISSSKNFLWKISPNRCEFTPVSEELSAWEENHLKILKGAFCTLLMGFQIQSPMANVDWLKIKKEYKDGSWTWVDPAAGIARLELILEPLKLKVTSEQKSEFVGEYSQEGSFPKLLSIQRLSARSGLRISSIEFQNFAEGRVQSVFPREIQNMNILILDDRFKDFQYYGQAQILRCE